MTLLTQMPLSTRSAAPKHPGLWRWIRARDTSTSIVERETQSPLSIKSRRRVASGFQAGIGGTALGSRRGVKAERSSLSERGFVAGYKLCRQVSCYKSTGASRKPSCEAFCSQLPRLGVRKLLSPSCFSLTLHSTHYPARRSTVRWKLLLQLHRHHYRRSLSPPPRPVLLHLLQDLRLQRQFATSGMLESR